MAGVLSFIIVRGANSPGFIGFVTSDMPGALSFHLDLARQARFDPGPTPNSDKAGLAVSVLALSGLLGWTGGSGAGGLCLAEISFAS